MEVPSKKMEEIYAIPIKYIESWLELKESGGFKEFWVVLKTHYMFFFKDQNTHCKEQYVGYLDIEVGETKCTSKKGNKENKCDFMVEIVKKKKFLFRASDDILRRRWIYALELVARAEPPGPLPGDPDFRMPTVFTPSPRKMKEKRAQSLAGLHSRPLIAVPDVISRSFDDSNAVASYPKRDNLSLDLERKLTIDEAEKDSYDSVFIPPSWYFNNLSRVDAMSLLNNQKIGTYLLRNTESTKAPDHYTLSIRDIDRIKHHKINAIQDGCYFEGAPNAPFHSPVDAVSYLMKSKYSMLNPQPMIKDEVRDFDNGEEEISRRETTGSFRELNDYHCSPVTPSFGGHLPYSTHIESHSRHSTPLLPSPPQMPKKHGPPTVPAPPEEFLSSVASSASTEAIQPRKIQTLPSKFAMRNRPLPKQPVYENGVIIRRHNRFSDESYVDMKANFNNNGDEEDTPPPLPRKKSLPQRIREQEPYYVNVPFYDENDGNSDYETPVQYLNKIREQRRRSQP